ncbi:MAG: methyl-accepting chemotaxis protein [Lachnospiraceae bacterium]|nr:methyl-accepting chemotaxis protein [Lachnospiraceae bacterium]
MATTSTKRNTAYSAKSPAGTAKRKGANGGAQSRLNMRVTLILFALIPLVVSSVIISIFLYNGAAKETKRLTHNALVQVIEGVGNSFDSMVNKNKEILKAYSSAPIVKEALENPNDPKISEELQKYTEDYFGKLDGWEGIYVADWDTVVLSHPTAPPLIGKPLREGNSLKQLQSDMLSAPDGVYNTGIMTSPGSGELIMSMYYPVEINGEPKGYVGCGFYINSIASAISDVSGLNLSSAYVYYVDNQGTMLYHPDESKIGNPVENAAVKGLLAQLSAGQHPQPDIVEYDYKGKTKYAGYYVGAQDHYIAVLTADEDDVLSGLDSIRLNSIIICIVCVLIFTVIALLIERIISVPLITISKSLEKLATGDVTVQCNAKSHIKETVSIIQAFKDLRDALSTSMKSVKDSAFVLNNAIVSVDGKTGDNVESVSQINTAINEVAETSQSVAENAQTMAEKAAELGNDIELLNDNVHNLFDASQTIKNANNEATECMKSVYAGANESVDAMRNITDKINETNSAIAEIGSAVQAIESIAAQTNLLSLNASIEAARAGEAGRGFAVVADEIRSLADSSAQSAKEIKQIIENVIVLSNGTVDISNRVFDVINKEQADIEMAQNKFNVLSDSVEASISEIDTIRQMTAKLDSIKVDLSNATTELGAISEELGASAEEVAASCQTVTDACSDTQSSTAEMRNINDDMSAAIEFFKLSD